MPRAAILAFVLLAGAALPPAVATEVATALPAAPQVGMRTGTHPGYGRIVFDWPSRTDYEAEATAEGLVIRFAQPGRIALGATAPRNVVAVAAEGGAVRIETRPGVRFRHFHHGPKLVVDILDPGAPVADLQRPAAPSAEGVLADLAAATRLAPPARAAERPPGYASATPAAGNAAPATVISDAPLPAAAQATPPTTIRMAQSLPQGGPRMSVPVQSGPFGGASLLPQAQAQGLQPQPQIPGVPQVLSPAPGATLTRPLVLEQGSGRLVELPAAALTVLVADPRIARVQPASPTSLFIMGVNAGRTNLIATREDGSLVAEFDITVQSSAAAPGQVAPAAAAALPTVTAGQVQSMIRRTVRGGQNVRVTMVGRGAIALSGMVPTAADAQRAEAVAKAMGGEAREVINNLTLLSGIQVNLRVRVAEISREVTRDLGFNWLAAFNDGAWQIGLRTGGGVLGTVLSQLRQPGLTTGGLVGIGYTGGNFDINTIIDALAQDRLITILAEPNLTAQSGEVASFLAGGEFPVPVAAANNSNALTVEFKQFGVSLAFIPTVLSPERLNMRVRPEVSELSEANSVVFPVAGGTVRVPGLSVRRAETTIEVGSGQSFAIAGLLSRNAAINNSGITGLGDIPILGTLFRSDRFRRNETELVIIITPYLVRPVSDPAALATPLDSFRPSTDLERILLRRQTGSGAPYRQIRPPAAAGFIVE
jgi:pilus assembly protein CpaC